MKFLIYFVWLLGSLLLLAVVRNVARSELPQYSGLIMAVAFSAVIFVFLVIKDRFAKPEE